MFGIKTRLIPLLVVVILTTILIASCAGQAPTVSDSGDQEAPAATEGQEAPAATEGQEAPAATEGQEAPAVTEDVTAPAPQERVLRIALKSDVPTLDPMRDTNTEGRTLQEAIFEPLIDVNYGRGPEDSPYVPVLATEWEFLEEGRVIRLHLRENVQFSDGTPFNAQAVKRFFDRSIDTSLNLPRQGLWSFLKETRVVDDYTVEMVTETPTGMLLPMLAHNSAQIASPSSLDAVADVSEKPIGTGTYILESWDRGEKLVLRRNPNYWGTPPDFDKVEVLIVPDAAARANLLETGEVDVIQAPPPHDIERLNALDGIETKIFPTNRVIWLQFNTNLEPFDDLNVRKAIRLAINSDALVAGVLSGLGYVNDSMVAPGCFGYMGSDFLSSFDPDQAKALLEEAGLGQGFSTKLTVTNGAYFQDIATATAVQEMLSQVGIDVEVDIQDFPGFIAAVRTETEGNHEMHEWGWECPTGDAQYMFDRIIDSEQIPPGNWNTMYYSNSEVDELLQQSRSSTDTAEREQLLQEVQTHLAADVPLIPLYGLNQVYGVRETVDFPTTAAHPEDLVLIQEIKSK